METRDRTQREAITEISLEEIPGERRLRRLERAARIGMLTTVGSGIVAGGEFLITTDSRIIYPTLCVTGMSVASYIGFGEIVRRMRTEHLRGLPKQTRVQPEIKKESIIQK